MRGNPHSVQVQLSGQKARRRQCVPGREMIDNQWVPESRFSSHNSEIILNMFLPANLNLGRLGQSEILPSVTKLKCKYLERADFCKTFYPLLTFPGSYLSGVFLISRNCRGGKIISFCSWWWGFCWDSLSSRSSHKCVNYCWPRVCLGFYMTAYGKAQTNCCVILGQNLVTVATLVQDHPW